GNRRENESRSAETERADLRRERLLVVDNEVLDVLVQSKRTKHAALKLMRKLLKRYAFAPERLVTDNLRSYGSAAREFGLERRRERGRWKNNRAERRRLQHLQPTKPSHLSPNPPCASRCGDHHVAERGRRGLTIPVSLTLRARGIAT